MHRLLGEKIFPIITVAIVAVGVFFISTKIFSESAIRVSPTTLNNGHSEAKSGFNSIVAKKYWRERIGIIGPMATLNEIRNYYDGRPAHIEHTAGHIFGGLLFEIYGLGGVRYCDPLFTYSCFHQFFGSAVLDSGATELSEISASCKTLRTKAEIYQCFHGIGHGLVGITDYSVDGLESALASCDLIESDVSHGCYGGAVMEYHQRFLLHGAEDTSINPLAEGEDIYSPCSVLKHDFQNECYIFLPDWWQYANYNNRDTLGERCARIIDKDKSNSCFVGIGFLNAWMFNYDPDKLIVECAKMPTPDGVGACDEGAARTIEYNTRNTSGALRLCGDKNGDRYQSCRDEINRISRNITPIER
jgi:hypothetical protein